MNVVLNTLIKLSELASSLFSMAANATQNKQQVKQFANRLQSVGSYLNNIRHNRNFVDNYQQKIRVLEVCLAESRVLIKRLSRQNFVDDVLLFFNANKNKELLEYQENKLLRAARDLGIDTDEVFGSQETRSSERKKAIEKDMNKLVAQQADNLAKQGFDKKTAKEIAERQKLSTSSSYREKIRGKKAGHLLIPYNELSWLGYKFVIKPDLLTFTENIEKNTIYLRVKDKDLHYLVLDSNKVDIDGNPLVIKDIITRNNKEKLKIPPDMKKLDESLKTDVDFKKNVLQITTSRNHTAWQQQVLENVAGTISSGKWLSHPVTIKLIKGEIDGNRLTSLVREARIMNKLRNPFIAQIYGICLEKKLACIVMEYLPNRLDRLLKNGCIAANLQKSLAIDIANGLNYLHSRDIIHRALRPEAIFLNFRNQAKLGELNLAKANAELLASMLSTVQRPASCGNNQIWQAPELQAAGGIVTSAADIYSYGMLLRYLFTGQQPSKNKALSRNIPEPIRKLIKSCCQEDPQSRPDALLVLQSLRVYQPIITRQTSYEIFRQGVNFEEQKDYKQARNSYMLALQKGNQRAGTRLGMLYSQGIALVQDEKMDQQLAVNLLGERARAGDELARTNLLRIRDNN